MDNRILVKLRCEKAFLILRTVSGQDEGRRRDLYLPRRALCQLEQEDKVTVNDGADFVVFLRYKSSDTVMLTVYRLRENFDDTVSGYKQQFMLRYSQLRDYLTACPETGEAGEWQTLSLQESAWLPKLVFSGSRNLHQVVNHRLYRKKLSHYLKRGFHWPGATEIRLYDDFVPYSFLFKELRGDDCGITGGLILHGQDDPETAYYSIHT